MKKYNIKPWLLVLLSSYLLLGSNAIAKTPNEKNIIITNKHNKDNRMLTFDWEKFRIGSAEYPDGPTGCTVFYFPDRNVNAVVDIRGSAAGSILTNDLEHGGTPRLDAIVLAGGSTLGLEAATWGYGGNI